MRRFFPGGLLCAAMIVLESDAIDAIRQVVADPGHNHVDFFSLTSRKQKCPIVLRRRMVTCIL
jgi:hypothetical protein